MSNLGYSCGGWSKGLEGRGTRIWSLRLDSAEARAPVWSDGPYAQHCSALESDRTFQIGPQLTANPKQASRRERILMFDLQAEEKLLRRLNE